MTRSQRITLLAAISGTFVVGVDSGFEGTTAVYVTSVRVAIRPA